MTVDRGQCPKCMVIFKSKTVEFELQKAKCEYCDTGLKRVKNGSKHPVKFVNPPLVNIAGSRNKTFAVKRAEKIFGAIAHKAQETRARPKWRR